MIFYIGDTHFGHSNIIRLNNRPFSNVDNMDKTIIANWNSRVNPFDTVYILGDFAYKSISNPVEILQKLNGKKHLIIGNHDLKALKNPNFRKCFKSIHEMLTIIDNDEKIVLCHYPLMEWDGYFRGSVHIHGHIHNNITNNSFKYLVNEPNALNAGVDITNFTPVTLEELKKINQKFKLIFGNIV